METITLKIEGMTCQGCARSVKKALERVAGVAQADVSLERGEAQVRLDPVLANAGRLIDAVQEAGYSARA